MSRVAERRAAPIFTAMNRATKAWPRRTAAAALAASLLSACAPALVWSRPGVGPETLQMDLAECRDLARREATLESLQRRTRIAPYHVFDRHGNVVGTAPFPREPFDDDFFIERRMNRFCMRAKGYDLVPATGPGG